MTSVVVIGVFVFVLLAIFVVPILLGGFSSNPDPEEINPPTTRHSHGTPKSQRDMDTEKWRVYHKKNSTGFPHDAGEVGCEAYMAGAELADWEVKQERLHEYDINGQAPKGM